VVGLITDETAYREKFRDLKVWCQENNLSLNVSKTKELIGFHNQLHINRAVQEQVESFEFHGIHITKDYSAFKKYSHPLTFPHFVVLQPQFKIE
jgi:hypothetical protein